MIGVFDSGIGGLTVLDALRRRLPRQDFLYAADTAHLPYGSKPPAMVRSFSRDMMSFLCDQGADAIVVACNTASACALPALRLECPVPVWGVVDAAVDAATRATSTGRVAVVATEATIATGIYQRKLAARGFRIWARACPALAEAVEKDSADTEVLVRHYLRDMHRDLHRVDTLVLGCTHFPLIRGVFERIAGPRVRVVDGAEVLARSVAAQMEDEGSGSLHCFASGAGRQSLAATLQ